MASPITLITPKELADTRSAWGAARVAFVPTMGALHEGHLSLVRAARERADRVLVSIFVNPMQFGPNEDFARYPRTLASDLALLSPLAVDAVFLPNTAMMYPQGFSTRVLNDSLAKELEGRVRPGHFDGVLTVVLKLLNLAQPHVALFGKKDYQQWRLIERMAEDLNLPVEILGSDTLREADGLAMSSRNRYLLDTERPLATRLYQGLTKARIAFSDGSRDPDVLVQACQQGIGESPGLALEYVELRRQADLMPFAGKVDASAVMLVAARVGSTRLIDNVELRLP